MVEDLERETGGVRGDESGYIVVETVGAFTLFVLLIISVLSLVNIVSVQARVHYALTQTANTLSMYCYVLEVLGVSGDLQAMDASAQVVSGEAGAMMDDINSILGTINDASDVSAIIETGGGIVDRASGWVSDTTADPQNTLRLLMNYGASNFMSMIFEMLARPLVGRYLSSADMTGDQYLIGAGVVNKNTGRIGLDALEFYQFNIAGIGNSVLIDRDGNVKLTVTYEVMYTFGGLRLPFQPTLKITQTVVTKAWLNGSGKGYPQ